MGDRWSGPKRSACLIALERVIRDEARADVEVDIVNGEKRRKMSRTSIKRIERELATWRRQIMRDDASPPPDYQMNIIHAQYWREYERFWSRATLNDQLMQKLEKRRKAAADETETVLGRIRDAARKEAQDAFFLGLTEPASIPMSEEGQRAIREAVNEGFVFADVDQFSPFLPSRNEKALRVYQAAYNEHMRGLR